MAARCCCACNKKSRCLRCSCVKKGSSCVNCVPISLDKCRNQAKTQDPVASSGVSSTVSNQHHHNVASPSLTEASDTSSSEDEDEDYDPGIPSVSRIPPTVVQPSIPSNGGPSIPSNGGPVTNHSPSPSPPIVGLPPFRSVPEPEFRWKFLYGPQCMRLIDRCYDVAVHWIPDLFKVPHGRHGKSFVAELASLFRDYAQESAKECIALKAAFLFPLLMLQKPHRRSKSGEHVSALERRLLLWRDGNFEELLKEGQTLQKKFTNGSRKVTNDIASTFASLMFQGKVKAALRLLNGAKSKAGQPLSLDTVVESNITVKDKLSEKHPEPASLDPSCCLLQTTPPPDHEPHFVEFHQIDGGLIRSLVLRMDGAAGPSGMDASHWKKVCTSFAKESDNVCGMDASHWKKVCAKESDNVCDAIAMVARKLCSSYVDPVGVSALVASRLIALNKDPGVRPIGIGEVIRRVIGKAILSVVKSTVMEVTGSVQLCAGVSSVCEAVVETVKSEYESDSVEGVLLVDASNAFNSLNRNLALRNILHLCPSLGRVLVNLYRIESSLFIGKDTLLSKEGTTQGDPLAMIMYAVASVPLINKLSSIDGMKQLWYADDATGIGTVNGLKEWWSKINDLGGSFGYKPNAVKSTLLVKTECYNEACELFKDTDVKVTCEGVVMLGCPVGSPSFVECFVSKKVNDWCRKLKVLAGIALSQPQSAYCAFSHGLFSEWTYLFRVCEVEENMLKPLEECMRQVLIPAILGNVTINDIERDLLSLPTRCGGLGLYNPMSFYKSQRSASVSIVKPLVDVLRSDRNDLPPAVIDEMSRLRKESAKIKEFEFKNKMNDVRLQLPQDKLRLFEVSVEKGSSTWLTALPLRESGLDISKGEFRDAVCLRYGWRPSDLPLVCICGESFTIAHSLMCVYGGFVNQRHDDIRDLSVSLVKEVCHNVCKEPVLQPLSGESFRLRSTTTEDNARLDLSADGFWGHRFRRTYFDVRVFCPLSSTNTARSLSACYKENENIKKRKYEQRIQEVEHASFSPLVFSSSGGCAPVASLFIKKLALLHSAKHHQQYSKTINFNIPSQL